MKKKFEKQAAPAKKSNSKKPSKKTSSKKGKK